MGLVNRREGDHLTLFQALKPKYFRLFRRCRRAPCGSRVHRLTIAGLNLDLGAFIVLPFWRGLLVTSASIASVCEAGSWYRDWEKEFEPRVDRKC